MKTGWIKLHRCLTENIMWEEKPFSRGQAWVDLILLANHKDGYIRKRGIKVDIKRGQVGWSILALSERWGWSRGKVIRFVDELETVQQIVQHKKRVTTLITIVNYHEYQRDDTTGSTTDGQQTDTKRTLNGQQTDTNKNGKNGKNGKNKDIKKKIPKRTQFVKPTIEQITEYCIHRKNKVDPERWFDHYTSNGWRVGKNQMKDWKAAIRTWESNKIGGQNGKGGGSSGKGFTEANRSGETNWIEE